MTELMKLEELLVKGQMSRREFLGRVSILGLTGVVSPALWKSIAHAETPKKGGNFRIGLVGASTAESLDPATYGTGVINHFMVGAIGNCLTEIDHKGEAIPPGTMRIGKTNASTPCWLRPAPSSTPTAAARCTGSCRRSCVTTAVRSSRSMRSTSLPAAARWPMAPWPQTEMSMAGSRWSAGGLSHPD